MKKRSGLLIRLIDVVLILLFGFISISQVEKRSRIDLPVSTETLHSRPDRENLIRVAVAPLQPGEWGFLVENETRLLKDARALQHYLIQKSAFFQGDVRVKIYAEAGSPMRYTMLAADLCEHLQLKKSLVVRMSGSKSGLPGLEGGGE